MENQKRFLLAGLCLLSVLLVFGCAHLSGSAPKEAEPPKEFAAMMAKKDELAALPTTENLSKNPEVKGKIVIVRNSNGTISLDRFHEDGSTFFTDAPVAGEIYTNFLPAELYARRPEEIETLIKINCVTKKDSALYTNSNSLKDEMMEYDYQLCDVAFVDYKTATVFAKKQIGKNEAPKVINDRTYGRTPGKEIAEYLRSVIGTDKTSGL